MTNKKDYYTRTVSAAAAFARIHAEIEPDDRPTAAELAQEAFEDSLECPLCGAKYGNIEVNGSECLCDNCNHEWEVEYE